GGVRRGPAGVPELVGGQAPDRAGSCGGALRGVAGVPEFVQRAGVLVDHDRVTVAASVLAAFDLGSRTERVRALVALARELELDVHQRVRVRDDRVRDSEGVSTLVRAEVRVQV